MRNKNFDHTVIADNAQQDERQLGSSGNVPVTLGGYDLEAMRLPQNFGGIAGVKKVLTTVPCRKPSNQIFVRVHPDEAWSMTAAVLQLKEDGECYLVLPELYVELAQEVRPKMLYTGMTRDGNPFLWPVNMPGEDGRLDSWSQSAHTAANLAKKSWVRLVANRTVGAYDVMQATNLAEEPAWPELTFGELINLAFRDKVIDSTDHVIVRRLRGEM
jgi:hypothetical protein